MRRDSSFGYSGMEEHTRCLAETTVPLIIKVVESDRNAHPASTARTNKVISLKDNGSITRTLKRVIDADGYRTITSDALLQMSLSEYQQLRRDVTIRKRTGAPRYFCQECGHAVYAPRHRQTGPYWRHFTGAPEDCPWWTGTPSSADQISKHQFHGQQESPLHHRLKYLISELLLLDGRSTSIIVEEKVIGVDGYRRPDVKAEFSGRPLAFELQLSTTQFPIIIARELFYEAEGRHLIWLTWDFVACKLDEVRQAFLDIRTSHNDNLFTIDEETVVASRSRGCFVFRVLWWQEGECISKLVTLDDLAWPASGLAFAVAPPPPWHVDFKTRWIGLPTEWAASIKPRRELWVELTRKLNLDDLTENHSDTQHVTSLLNCLLSLEAKRPIGSKQKNLIEMANSFLNTDQRHRYVKIFEYAARVSGNTDLLARTSVRDKISRARLAPQVSKASSAAKIVRSLFPNWTATT